MKPFINWLRDAYIRHLGKGIRCSKKSNVIDSLLGEYVHIGDYAFVYKCTLGAFTTVGRSSVLRNANIGKYCSISWGVTVGATPHRYDLLSSHAFHYIKSFGFVEEDSRISIPVDVGCDVWIGTNAVIMPGLNIGHGAVIGAGAVVTKDVEPYSIVAGVPAKIIKYRFEDSVIRRLLESKWWDLDREKIMENIDLFKESLSEDTISRLNNIL